jgi:hypothetical protein
MLVPLVMSGASVLLVALATLVVWVLRVMLGLLLLSLAFPVVLVLLVLLAVKGILAMSVPHQLLLALLVVLVALA